MLGVLALCLAACTQRSANTPQHQDTNMDVATRNKSTARAFLKALENENIDEVVAIFAENGRHINPYASGIFPSGAAGREEIRAYWTPVFPNFDGMSFPIDEIYALEDPSQVYVKFKGRIKLKNQAAYYENDYYAFFRFDENGLITEYVELFNPIVAARGFGLLGQIK
ncbi:MAG: nuclear transport factor 2 family protein [Bacteroidetes bacterium]|nr:nuclear transport factor 2 family protein [Bacteroidota bacterium]